MLSDQLLGHPQPSSESQNTPVLLDMDSIGPLLSLPQVDCLGFSPALVGLVSP